jgi:HK97 gp10 family phage protein
MATGKLRDSKSGVKIVWNGDEVKKRAEQLAKKSSFEIGLDVEGTAKRLAPLDTGRLTASITTVSGTGQRTKPSGKGAVSTDVIAAPSDAFETFVGSPVSYAAYVEYGTFTNNAQPYLRPALDISKGKAPSIVQRDAKKEFGDYLNPKGVMTFEEAVEASNK